MRGLPNHAFFIPDGSGRWAEQHGRFRSEGHQKGTERFHEISRAAFEMGIRYFTFWAASRENLKKREDREIVTLILLLQHELGQPDTLTNLRENETRFRVLGEWYEILHERHFLHLRQLLDLVHSLQGKTKSFDRHFLTILFGYSGIGELAEAERKICDQPSRNIKPGILRRMLETRDLPPVDLIIRTGAERPNWFHASDGVFSPWLTPESQISISTTLWPDFTEEEFRKIVAAYSETPRRFGA